MRHKMGYKKLNRTSEHRKALIKNMLNSLIKYEQITTTLPKAKVLKPQADKIITLIIDTATVKLKSISWLIISPKIIKIIERIKPLINPKPISLNSLLKSEPLITWFAIPWTIIAEDWTPTLPAIAAIKGV